MKIPRLFMVLVLVAFGTGMALADETAAAPILPKQFAGWQMSGASRVGKDPAAADPVNTSLLKEYGFSDFAFATYTRDDGRKLTVKAARFPDASGAYGAFTYYRTPVMLAEKVGDQGASLNERVLFYRGNVLVDAVFEKLNAMSAAELRELANLLPPPSGAAQNLASFLSYMPRRQPEQATVKYVLGPVGLRKISTPIPSDLVDFSTGAEVATATFSSAGGETTLMLISYPTPQVAAARLRAIDAAQAQNTKEPGSVPALNVGPIFDKRTGPIVAVVAGAVSRGEAQSLLSSVNYEANVTWNESNPFDPHNNIGSLIWNVLLLCGILIGLALIAGLAFGGIRILLQRFFPGRIFRRPDEVEFISLQLDEINQKRLDS